MQAPYTPINSPCNAIWSTQTSWYLARMAYTSFTSELFVISYFSAYPYTASTFKINRLDLTTKMNSTLVDRKNNEIQFISSSTLYYDAHLFMLASITISDQTLYTSDGRNLYNLTRIDGESPKTYDVHNYSVLSTYFTTHFLSNWSFYITGIAAVASQNSIYVAIAIDVNAILKINMNAASESDIVWVGGDRSQRFTKDEVYSSSASLFVPSHLTYDPEQDLLFFAEFAIYSTDIFPCGSRTIRYYSVRDNEFHDYAGSPYFNGLATDGWAKSASFEEPTTLSYANSSYGPLLYVVDHDAIREIYSSVSFFPSPAPTYSLNPTSIPSRVPTLPTWLPTLRPTRVPSSSPSRVPSLAPSPSPSTTPTMTAEFFVNVSTLGSCVDFYSKTGRPNAVQAGRYLGKEGVYFTVGVSLCFLYVNYTRPGGLNSYRNMTGIKIVGNDGSNAAADGPIHSTSTALGYTGRMTYDDAASKLFVLSSSIPNIYNVRIVDFSRANVSTIVDRRNFNIQFGINLNTGLSPSYSYLLTSITIYNQILYVSNGTQLHYLTQVSNKSVSSCYDINPFPMLTAFFNSKISTNLKYYIGGITVMPSQSALYIVLTNDVNVILKIPLNPASVNDIIVVAGDITGSYRQKNGFVGLNPANATFSYLSDITADPTEQSLYTTEGVDNFNKIQIFSPIVRKYNVAAQTVSTYAGKIVNANNTTKLNTFAVDGLASKATFLLPVGISFAFSWYGPVLFVADFLTYTVRQIYTTPSYSPSLHPTLALSKMAGGLEEPFDSFRSLALLESLSSPSYAPATTTFNQVFNQCKVSAASHTYYPTTQPTVASSIPFNINSSESSILSFAGSGKCTLGYYESIYRGVYRLGGSTDWGTFLYNVDQTAGDYTSVPPEISLMEYASLGSIALSKTYHCNSNSTALRLLWNAIQYGVKMMTNCDGHVWKVDKCNDVTKVCVDCATVCTCQQSSMLSAIIPANSSCTSEGHASAICVSLTPLSSFYPSYISLKLDFSVGNIGTVTIVGVSNQGFLYCALFSSPLKSLSDVTTIKETGVGMYVSSPGNYIMNFTNIVPRETYTALCYTEGINRKRGSSFVMPLDIVLSKSVTATFSSTSTVVLSFPDMQMKRATLSSPFTLTLDAKPSHSITVSIVVYVTGPPASGTCPPYTATAAISGDVVAPNEYLFDFNGVTLHTNLFFFQPSTVGCYFITADISGSSASDYQLVSSSPIGSNGQISINVLNSTVSFQAPFIVSSAFSNDGTGLSITFQTATDRGAGIGLASQHFSCQKLFDFKGAAYATCMFSTNNTVEAVLSGASTIPLPTIGDSIKLLRGVLRPLCTERHCNTSNSNLPSTVTISAPLDPVSPIPIIIMPQEVSICDNVTISISKSVGSGGRGWKEVAWKVFTADGEEVSDVADYLNSDGLAWPTLSSGSTSAVSLPIKLMPPGNVYVFVLTLTNFFGLSGTGSSSIKVISNSIPLVTIAEGNYVTMKKSDDLKLHARAFFPSCPGIQPQQLQFTWILYRENALNVKIRNQASQASNFYVPADSFEVEVNYFVELVVINSETKDRTSAYVTISVVQGDIVALISGGSLNSITPFTQFILSGNNSYDEDSGPLSFTWSCFQLKPIASSCPGFGNLVVSSSTLLIPKNFSMPSTMFLFLLTVYDDTRVSIASVEVSTGSLGSQLPAIMLSDLEFDFRPSDLIINPNQDTILQSNILYSSMLKLEWRSPTLGLTLSTVNASLSAADNSVSFNYRLIPSSFGLSGLVRDQTFVFQLVATPLHCMTCKSVSEITLTINAPPVPGLFLVIPAVGLGIGSDNPTYFSFDAVGWSDDNLPLSYSFILDIGEVGRVSMQEQSGSTHFLTTLPAGEHSDGYEQLVVLAVFDSYGASSESEFYPSVEPPPAIAIANFELLIQTELLFVTTTASYDLLPLQAAAFGKIMSNSSVFLRENHSNNVAGGIDVLTRALFLYYAKNLHYIDFSDPESYLSASTVCSVLAESVAIQYEKNNTVISSAVEFSSLLASYISTSRDVSDVTSLYSCLSLLSAASSSSASVNNRRVLSSPSIPSFDASTLRNLKQIFDIAVELLNAVENDLVDGENYAMIGPVYRMYIERGALSNLRESSFAVPLTAEEQKNKTMLSFGNFSSVLYDSTVMNYAKSYSVKILSTTALSDPHCDSVSPVCELVGSPAFVRYDFTVTGQYPSPLIPDASMDPYKVNAQKLISVTSSSALNVTSSFTHNAPYDYNISCPSNFNEILNFSCSSNLTNGAPYGPVQLNCLYNQNVTGTCPVYNVRVRSSNSSGYIQPNCYCGTDASEITTCECLIKTSVAQDNGGTMLSYVIESGLVLSSALDMQAKGPFFQRLPVSPPSNNPKALGEAVRAQVDAIKVVSIVVPLGFACIVLMIFFAALFWYRKRLLGIYKHTDPDKSDAEIAMSRQQLLQLVKFGLRTAKKGYLRRAEELFREAVAIVEKAEPYDSSFLTPLEAVVIYYELANALNAQGKVVESMPYLQKAHRIMQDVTTERIIDLDEKPEEAADSTLMRALHKRMTTDGAVKGTPVPPRQSVASRQASRQKGNTFYSLFMKPNPLLGIGRDSKVPTAPSKSGGDSTSNASSDDQSSILSEPDVDDEMDYIGDEAFSDSDEERKDDSDSVDTLKLKELIALKRAKLELGGKGFDDDTDDGDLPASMSIPPPPDDISSSNDDFIRSHTTVL